MRFPYAHSLRASLAGRRVRIALGVLCVTFAVLGVLVRYSFLQVFDVRASLAIQRMSGTALDAFMVALSFIGGPFTIPVFAVVIAWWLHSRGLRRGAIFLLLSLLAIPIDVALKEIWARARPDEAAVHVVVRQVGYSFPSGHAMLGTAFFGALAALSWIHLVGHRRRKPLTYGFAALPPLIDISRVYLGAHWLSDVVAGSAVGLALLLPMAKWYSTRIKADAVRLEGKAK